MLVLAHYLLITMWCCSGSQLFVAISFLQEQTFVTLDSPLLSTFCLPYSSCFTVAVPLQHMLTFVRSCVDTIAIVIDMMLVFISLRVKKVARNKKKSTVTIVAGHIDMMCCCISREVHTGLCTSLRIQRGLTLWLRFPAGAYISLFVFTLSSKSDWRQLCELLLFVDFWLDNICSCLGL